MESADPGSVRRVLLVGFMGSGKTSVGRRLARLLGWAFHDFDARVESVAGGSVSEIFRRHGEARFRELEAEVGRRLLTAERAVLASGGGWPAREGRMESLPEGTLSVWLWVSPEEAVRRARAEGATRPLLASEDAVERARKLLEERLPHYRKASLVLDSESAPPEGLARTIHESMSVGTARHEILPS
ncbi:MAG: hypothetical protein GWM92_09825 [Gemmatimonadetes bacterium]|nr:shikimate kinase [Gemmatimonadota bacterium]NIR77509.1 shikimate kinase [Gemmatimonadota bacterium]NIT87602.1 shikimate kinase [Gemmatimonadota bacterium]NIU29867.1 shikimate kinase [Gemmatimonadota bacterium]NIU34873.1 hypothetical protein [Gemmatimonadota bacterium]